MIDKTDNSPLPPQFQNWTGSFDELVATSTQLLSQLSPDIAPISGSVVRYYQQQGVVGRGKAKGRTREFSSKELEQVITAKQMADQKVPLSLVRSAYETETENTSKTPAETLVADMLRGTAMGGISGSTAPVGFAQSSSSPSMRQMFGSSRSADAGLSNFLAANMEAKLNTKSQYVSLPVGGTARYELSGGTAVELSTNGDIAEQAKALHNFADQLLAGNQPNND